MPLGSKFDLKKIPLGTDVSFREDEQHLHAIIQGKEYVVQDGDVIEFKI